MCVAGVQVHWTLVDNESSINIYTLEPWDGGRSQNDISSHISGNYRGSLGPHQSPSSNHSACGTRRGPLPNENLTNFVIVDLPSNYNAIPRKPMPHELKAITSIYHYCMKFSTYCGAEIICKNQYNVNYAKPQIYMIGGEQNARHREAKLKRPIVTDLSEIGISEKHRWKPIDDLSTLQW